jgi:hypothetical protein
VGVDRAAVDVFGVAPGVAEQLGAEAARLETLIGVGYRWNG